MRIWRCLMCPVTHSTTSIGIPHCGCSRCPGQPMVLINIVEDVIDCGNFRLKIVLETM